MVVVVVFRYGLGRFFRLSNTTIPCGWWGLNSSGTGVGGRGVVVLLNFPGFITFLGGLLVVLVLVLGPARSFLKRGGKSSSEALRAVDANATNPPGVVEVDDDIMWLSSFEWIVEEGGISKLVLYSSSSTSSSVDTSFSSDEGSSSSSISFSTDSSSISWVEVARVEDEVGGRTAACSLSSSSEEGSESNDVAVSFSTFSSGSVSASSNARPPTSRTSVVDEGISDVTRFGFCDELLKTETTSNF